MAPQIFSTGRGRDGQGASFGSFCWWLSSRWQGCWRCVSTCLWAQGLGGSQSGGDIILGLPHPTAWSREGLKIRVPGSPKPVSFQFPREPRAELVLRVGQGTVGHMSRAWISAWQPSWYLGLGPESSFGIPHLPPRGLCDLETAPSPLWAKFRSGLSGMGGADGRSQAVTVPSPLSSHPQASVLWSLPE